MNRRNLLKISGTLIAGSFLTKSFATPNLLSNLTTDTPNLDLDLPLYLHFNENSLGISPKAQQAIINEMKFTNRYPDNLNTALKESIAHHLNVLPSEITLGNGSSDIIRGLINMYKAKALKNNLNIQLITPTPSFSLAAEYAATQEIKITEIPLNNRFEMNISKMQKKAQDFEGLSICYLCNPNNPTGIITPTNSISNWINTANKDKTVFIVDEAYFEYITQPDYINGLNYIKEQKSNVIVLRTFSKIYAMAGMRVGYSISSQNLAEELANYVTIFNITTLACAAAKTALTDEDFFQKSLASNKVSLEITSKTLNDLDIEYLPTQANFIFHKIKGDPQEYIDRMKDAGIIVGRPFPPLTNWSRVTLGLPHQMEYFTKTLKAFREKNWI